MPQHDYSIANQSGAAFRADLNNALAAIVSQNSGTAEPSTTYAYMPWADTTNGLFKIRNAANSGWITLYQLDGEWSRIPLENGTAGAPSLYFKNSGTDTGVYSSGTNQVGIATGGVQRVNFNGSTEVVFNDGGADFDFRIEGDTEPNLFKIDAGTDQVQVVNLNGGPLAGARNRIINGDMRVWQRGTTFTNIAVGTYTADRFTFVNSGTVINGTVIQHTLVPSAEFKYSIRLVPASSGTPTEFALRQTIEQNNVYDLAGKSVTASAWVRCSKSQVKLRVAAFNATGAGDDYTLATVVPGIWTKITYTSAAYSSVTAWTSTPNDLGGFVDIGFDNSIALTTGDYLYVTGVQLEAGSVATPFERRSFGQELALCQRYFLGSQEIWQDGTRRAIANVTGRSVSPPYVFPTTMRAAPTAVVISRILYKSNGTQFSPSQVSLFRLNANQAISVYDAGSDGNFDQQADNVLESLVTFSAEL